MPTVDQLQAEIAQLQAQQALTIQAIRAFAEGRLDGPDSVKWLLAAISPADQAIQPAPFAFGQ